MNRTTRQIARTVVFAALTFAATAQPSGHQPPNARLDSALHKALPQGATQVASPLAVDLGAVGRVQVVLYHRDNADTLFRGIVLIPTSAGYNAVPLPTEVDSAGNYEEVTTSIFATGIDAGQRALVILYYAHEFGKTTSSAFGRVFTYDSGAFRIDEVRSHLLDGVRTAAVARIRLAPKS